MWTRRCLLVLGLLVVLVSVSAVGAEVTSVTPSSGPASGGTKVTLKGDFAGWPYGVVIGGIGAVTEHVDDHTLIATTPVHLPGKAPIGLFEYDIVLGTKFAFTFEGPVPEEFARLLLPVFTPPTQGAFGSEFHTELRMMRTQPTSVSFYGIAQSCPFAGCTWDYLNQAFELGHFSNGVKPDKFKYDGTPGRFVYVSREKLDAFAATLHVRDVTRSELNFGTEVPIVRSDRFATRILLQGVPTDPRFRSRLLMYAAERAQVTITVERRAPVTRTLEAGADIFAPAYADFSDFPIGVEPVNVTIDSAVPIWALVSVTNNDTQLITTITPQP